MAKKRLNPLTKLSKGRLPFKRGQELSSEQIQKTVELKKNRTDWNEFMKFLDKKKSGRSLFDRKTKRIKGKGKKPNPTDPSNDEEIPF